MSNWNYASSGRSRGRISKNSSQFQTPWINEVHITSWKVNDELNKSLIQREQFKHFKEIKKYNEIMKNNSKFSYAPLKFNENLKLISLASLDIETFEDQYSKEQIPLCITACIKLNSNVSNNNSPDFATICILLDGELFNSSILNREKALSNLWKSFWSEVNKICLNEGYPKVTFMVHNLGKFDGSFLIKGLMYAVNYNLVQTLIDNQHKFITISAPLKDVKIVMRDSMRIFPVSLQQLCEVFNVKGKFSKYNKEFNKLSILKPGNPLHKQFLNYAVQDSISLLNSMSKAQIIYFKNIVLIFVLLLVQLPYH